MDSLDKKFNIHWTLNFKGNRDDDYREEILERLNIYIFFRVIPLKITNIIPLKLV